MYNDKIKKKELCLKFNFNQNKNGVRGFTHLPLGLP